jgi:integrase
MGATYDDLEEHLHDENVWVSFFSRIYDGQMPPLRISDWRNAVVGKTADLNEINLKKGIMLRRIKKNQKAETEDIIPLPPSLVHFIRASHIKGELFPGMSVTDINTMITKKYGDKKANPHYWRSYYTVHKLTQMKTKEEIMEAVRIMDHSLKTNATYYNKQASSAYNDLIAGK